MRYTVTVKLKDAELDAVHEGFFGIDKLDISKDTPWNKAVRQILAPGGTPLTAEICGLGVAILRELREKFLNELEPLTKEVPALGSDRCGHGVVRNQCFKCASTVEQLPKTGIALAKPGVIGEIATTIRDRRIKAIDRAIAILDNAKASLASVEPALKHLDFVQGSFDPEDR